MFPLFPFCGRTLSLRAHTIFFYVFSERVHRSDRKYYTTYPSGLSTCKSEVSYIPSQNGDNGDILGMYLIFTTKSQARLSRTEPPPTCHDFIFIYANGACSIFLLDVVSIYRIHRTFFFFALHPSLCVSNADTERKNPCIKYRDRTIYFLCC